MSRTKRKWVLKDVYLVVCEEGVVYATEDFDVADSYAEEKRTQSIRGEEIEHGFDGDEEPSEVEGDLYEVIPVSLDGKKSGDVVFFSGEFFEDSISYDAILDVFHYGV